MRWKALTTMEQCSTNAYINYYIVNVLAKLLIHELPLGWIWRGINACCSVVVNQFSLRQKTFLEGLKAGNQAGSKIPMGTVAQGVRETSLAPTQAQLGDPGSQEASPSHSPGNSAPTQSPNIKWAAGTLLVVLRSSPSPAWQGRPSQREGLNLLSPVCALLGQ